MLDWIYSKHAGYVLAAYGVAAIALIALAALSWRDNRRVGREWQALQPRRPDDAR